MATYLDEILADHRARAALDGRGRAELEALVADAAPTRPFLGALTARAGALHVIAEVKRRSPSRGDLAPGLDPARLARAYASGGAACLSVLTDETYFGGSVADLARARAAVDLPVLRKDFTVGEADLFEARAMGADAVLLIVAALGAAELEHLLGLSAVLSLAALVEVHDEAELARALGAGAACIGVNQRDLRTFEVDPRRAVALRGSIPAGIVTVAESGIRTAEDLERLVGAGFDAALIGETLVTAADPAAALAELLGARSSIGR